PGWWFIAQVRRRHRGRDVGGRPGRRDRRLCPRDGDRPRPGPGRPGQLRDVVLAGPRRAAGREPERPRHPPAGRPLLGGRSVRRPRLPAALLAIGLASIAIGIAPPRAAATDEVSFGNPDAVADYGTSITFTVDVTRSVPLERAELRLRLPDTIGDRQGTR